MKEEFKVFKLRSDVGPVNSFLFEEKKPQKPKHLHAKSRFRSDVKIVVLFGIAAVCLNYANETV